MFSFDVALYALPPGLEMGEPVSVRGVLLRPLQASPTQLSVPLPVQFEDAMAAMQQLPRMFAEPDGSFVWVSSQGEPAWQLDGMLYDRNDRLLRVDVKGSCTAEALAQLLDIVRGGPAGAALVFQLTREALLLDQRSFYQYAAQP